MRVPGLRTVPEFVFPDKERRYTYVRVVAGDRRTVAGRQVKAKCAYFPRRLRVTITSTRRT